MRSSTRLIVIASLASIFAGLSLSAMAENPPKHHLLSARGSGPLIRSHQQFFASTLHHLPGQQ